MSIYMKKMNLKNSTQTYFLLVAVTIVPFLFSLLYERQREEDFIFIFLNSAILLFPLYFIKNHKLYFLLLFPILLFPALFDFGHIYLYQGRISESIYFILFDTNPAESAEYLESNLSMSFILSLLLYIVFSVGFMLRVYKLDKVEIETKWYKYLLLWIAIPFAGKYFASKQNLDDTLEAYRRSNHFFSMVYNYTKYQEEMDSFQKFKEILDKKIIVYPRENIPHKELYVLIIGESTTSTHMSLYGYHRKTTPMLESLKNDLTVFPDVVSSNPPGTMANLKKILTLANTETENNDLLGMNIVNIMKAAGFKTFWISNQLILGSHDTTTTVFANQADLVTYTNTTNSVTYDEKVLPILDRYLLDEADKKFLVIHLMGTHMKYRHRFPEEFKNFNETSDIPKRDFHNDKKLQYINDYDNAILYHDFILAEILKKIKNQNVHSALVYLSDHGEEVYDHKDLHGHPGTSPTLNMYKIPFFIWTSQGNHYEQFTNRKYVSDDVIYTMFDLFQVKGDFYHPEKSIVSENFVEKKRWMADQEI